MRPRRTTPTEGQPAIPAAAGRWSPRSIVFTYALLAALAWFVGAWVAFRILGFYPPRGSRPFLCSAWVVMFALGILVARIDEPSPRRSTAAALALVAFIIPVLAATSVPGVAQPKEFAVPGRPWLGLDAAPDGSFDLYVYKGDPKHIVPLGETPWNEETASLSPDRRHLVLAADRYGTYDLFVTDLTPAGTALRTRRLTQDARDEEDPEWSPDGRRIVFMERSVGHSMVESVPAAGGSATVIRTTPANAWNPIWSPDGSRLAYSAPSAGDPHDYDIWVSRADGSHPADVIDAGPEDWSPAWSPDGSKIAFDTGYRPYTDVYVANADGSGVRRLTASPGEDFVLGWSPDGSKVIFGSARSRTGGNFIYMMNPDGSAVQLVLRI